MATVRGALSSAPGSYTGPSTCVQLPPIRLTAKRGNSIEHALEHASHVLGTARVLTLAAQDLCTEHQSYLNWASLQLAETGLALVEASIEGLQVDAAAQ